MRRSLRTLPATLACCLLASMGAAEVQGPIDCDAAAELVYTSGTLTALRFSMAL